MDLLGHLLGNPMLKTGGGASDSEGGGGGGGGGVPEDGLVLKYHDATNNFTVGTSQWVSSIDGGPTLAYEFGLNVNDPPSAVSNGRVVYPNFGGLKPSQAILDEMNVDDLTLMVGCVNPSAGATLLHMIQSDDIILRAGPGAGGAQAISNRGGGQVSASTTITATGLNVIVGVYRRGGKVSIQANGSTMIDSAGSDSDETISISSGTFDGFPYADGGGGECGFIMAWSRALTESEIAAVLAEVTDNAEYGMGGYSP